MDQKSVTPVISQAASKGVLVPNAGAAQADEITLKEVILKIIEWCRYFLSKWVFILLIATLGGLVGFFYALYKEPVYKAELSFALEDEKGGGGLAGAAGIASLVGIDLGGGGGGAFSGDNLLELMKSRSMIQKAFMQGVDVSGKKITLAELYIDFNHMRENWKNKPELANVRFLPGADPKLFTRAQDSLLGVFHKSLTTSNLVVDKLDKKLSIIAVTVYSKNELFSKYFAEVLAKEVSDFFVETKTKKSVQNLAILQHQTDSVRRALNGAISGVAASVDANPNPNRARQVLQVPSQRRQVDVLANQAILTELVKNLEISKVSLRKETPLIQVIDRPILPLEIEKLGRAKAGVVGGLIAGFLALIYFSIRKIARELI